MSYDPSKALNHQVILLHGDEEVLRRRALEDTLATAGIQKDDFDLEIFFADAVDPSQWIGSAGTAPFLGERRCVVVRNLLRREADELPTSGLKGLPASSLLILVADDESGSEDKIQRLKTTVLKAWIKAVDAGGGGSYAFTFDAKGSRQAILDEVKQRGKTMTPAAADALIEMTGSSFTRALEELDKLVLFSGESDQIREGDVKEIVVPSREWNVFKMVEAILNNRVPEAIRQLRVLISGNPKPEDIAFRSILPVVSSELRLIWQGRLLVEANKTPQNATQEVLDHFPSKPNLVKEKEWRQRRVMGVARQVSLPQLAACFRILSDTDARLKGILDAFSSHDTLERMVMEMAGTMAPRR